MSGSACIMVILEQPQAWFCLFVCFEVLRPIQPNWVMSSAISLPNHTFYWAGLVL